MSNRFPSRDQLSAMNLDQLHALVPMDIEDEMAVQEIIDARFKPKAPIQKVFRDDVPDIKTVEEEAEWQKIIDQRAKDIADRSLSEEEKIEVKIADLEEEKAKIEAEIPVEEPVVEKVGVQCPECDFVAKNANGLRLHSKKHKTVENKEVK